MIHIVAYNAASTLSKVLDRIPPHVQQLVTEICVFDDASHDDTYLIGEGYRVVRKNPKLSVRRNPKNLGYGGNQKRGYEYAIEKGYDIVVLLHGDGQYAPEVMDELIAPIARGEADAVFGSRMMQPGSARQGGMPLYKFVGNRILSRLENDLLGLDLTEFHSGYRAYSVPALAKIPFEDNTNDFHFDTQIIIQLASAGYRIVEVPIPTYYGDEICHVNGFKYARDVVRSVFEYRMHRAGLKHRAEYSHVPKIYSEKRSPFSSHQRIIRRVRPGTRVLEVGCGTGAIARSLRNKGCTVFGVDGLDSLDAREACDHFEVADLEGDWEPAEGDFDYVLFPDILEHLRSTDILARARNWLSSDGRVVISTGNIALWVLRLSLLVGRFEYAPKGILDETHVRLYTRKTFRKLLESAGYEPTWEEGTSIPFSVVAEGLVHHRLVDGLVFFTEAANYQLLKLWPELLAYQFILEGAPTSDPA